LKVKEEMASNESGPNLLINELAGILKKEGMVTPPKWAAFVKTGVQAQRPPDNPDWWYVRAASILRQVYLRGPVGVGKLRNWYGGRKNRGVRPDKHMQAGGKIVRLCMQQLETAGLIVKDKVGRKVTPKGQSLLDKVSSKTMPRGKPVIRAVEVRVAEKPKVRIKKTEEAQTPTAPTAPAAPAPAAPAPVAEPAEKPKKPRAKKAAAPAGEAPAEKPKKAPKKKEPKPEGAAE